MVEVHIELTNECKLKCKHCSSEANSIGENKQFSEQDILEFISKIEDDFLNIVFTGGEPLLFGITELSSLFMRIKKEKCNVKIGLFTTGVMGVNDDSCRFINEFEIIRLKESGLSFAFFTMFSKEKLIHEFITDISTYDLTLHTIDLFVRNKLETNVNYVLSKFSSKETIYADIEFLKNRGVEKIRILRLIKHGRAVDNWNAIGISDSEQMDIIKNVILKKMDYIEVGGLPELYSCQGFSDNKCYAGMRKYYVDVRGDIYPCACVKKIDEYKIGNIYDHIYTINKFYNSRNHCLAIKQ